MSGTAPSVSTSDKYPGYTDAVNQMGQVAQKYIGQMGQPYGGQLVAGFSPGQQQAQTYLGNYLNNPASSTNYAQDPLYQAAQNQLQATVSGAYTSPNSPYTQQMSQYYMNQVAPQANALMNQNAARMGNLSGSGYEYMSGQLGQAAQNQLLAYGAQNYSTERQNQLNAVPQAESMAQLTQAAPQSLYNQLMSMGQGAQTQQQNELSAAYQEYQRQQNSMAQSLNPGSMLGAANAQNYSYDQGHAGIFSNYIAPALDAGASLTGNSYLTPYINALSSATSQGGAVNPWSQSISQASSLAGQVNPNGLSNWGGNTIQGGGNWWNPSSYGTNTGMQSASGLGGGQSFPTWSPY